MHEDVIMKIHDYINKNLFMPDCSWSEYEFRKRSYARWTAYEIINRIMETPTLDPFLIMVYLMHQADNFMDICISSNSELIFTTVRDTTEELLTLCT